MHYDSGRYSTWYSDGTLGVRVISDGVIRDNCRLGDGTSGNDGTFGVGVPGDGTDGGGTPYSGGTLVDSPLRNGTVKDGTLVRYTGGWYSSTSITTVYHKVIALVMVHL